MSLFSDVRRQRLTATVTLKWPAVFVMCVAMGTTVMAQTPPAPAASTPIADHVKRAAERPFYWIKRNAQTPDPSPGRNKNTVKPASRLVPSSVEVATPAPPATRSRDRGITERVTPLLSVSPAPAAADTRLDRQDLNAALEQAPPAAGPAPGPTSAEREPASGETRPSSPPATAADSPSAAPLLGTAEALAPPKPAEVTNSLRLLSQVEPEFPGPLQRRLRKGSVEVSFTVLPDGSVSAPSVLRSSHPRLEAPALAAVAQWRFAPLAAAKAGVVEVGFNLDP